MKKMSLMLLVFLFSFNLFSTDAHSYEIKEKTEVIVSHDPIHPYIHALFGNNNTYDQVILLNKELKIVTEKVKQDIQNYYEEKNSDAISKYLEEESIDFLLPNKYNKSLTSNSVRTIPLRYSDRWDTYAYNRDKSLRVGYAVGFSAQSFIHLYNNKIVEAKTVKWIQEFSDPYVGSPYNLSKPHTIINNGYTSRIQISFGMEI